MVRLEYSDAKSNKFWEASIQGTDLVLRWGKIDTKGQTKTKSFHSEDAAVKEFEKQKRSKLKKGYAEVDSSAMTQEEPNREQTATEQKVASKNLEQESVELVDESLPRIHWTKKARQHLFSESTPVKIPTAKAASKKLFKDWEAEPWQKGLGQTTPALAQELRPVLARLSSQALGSGGEEGFELPPLAAALLDFSQCCAYWAATGRLDQAVRGLVCSDSYDAMDESKFKFLYRVSADSYHEPIVTVKDLKALRSYLAQAEPTVLEAALAATEDVFEAAQPITQSALSFLFPQRPEWAAKAAKAVRLDYQGRHYIPERCWILIHSLTESGDFKLFYRPFMVPPLALPRLVQVMGSDCLELMQEITQNAYDTLPILNTLAMIECPRVAAFLAEKLAGKLSKKAERKTLTEYFERFPELALRTLPGKGGDIQNMVTSLVRGNPEMVQRLLPELSESVQSSLQSILKKLGPSVEEAPASSLPDLLMNPPWTKKKKEAKAKVLALEELPWEARVDWRDQKIPRAYYYDRPPKLSTPKRIEDDIKFAHSIKSYRPLNNIDRWVDEAVLHLLNEEPGDFFDTSYCETEPVLARFGTNAIPGLLKMCAKKVPANVDTLSYIIDPGVAKLFAANLSKKTVQKVARTWFRDYPDATAIGLIPLVFGKNKKKREQALAALAFVPPENLWKVAQQYDVEKDLREVLDVDPLSRYPAKLDKLPEFARPELLPPLLLEDRKSRLPASAVESFLTMLSFSDPASPYQGLETVRGLCHQDSLEDFCWELFQKWISAGSSSKIQWAFTSLGDFGTDDTARKLTPMIRKWPGESAHARAVVGLEVLAGIGSDIALMNLNGIAQKLKFKGLQAKAKEKIQEIAKNRGLSSEELEDRLVPDLGLSAEGRRTLDFGPRQFEVCLDEALRPYLLSDGKRIKTLPKPNKKDDETLSAQATKDWKAFKKDNKAIAKGQLHRLERAMSQRRRWKASEFQLFMVDHPLMFCMAQRLVWGVYDEDGKLHSTFRVSEDRSLADIEDEEFSLPETAIVGIPHPLEVAKETLATWQNVFADYEILQPYEQLGRSSYRLSEEELKQNRVLSCEGKTLPYTRFLRLEDRGWRRGEGMDGGVAGMEKHFYTGQIAELVLEPGLYLGALQESGEQTIHQLILRDDRWRTLKLEDLDPILASELLYDMEAL